MRRETVKCCGECGWFTTIEQKYDGTIDLRFKPTFCSLWDVPMASDGNCRTAIKKSGRLKLKISAFKERR